MGRVQVDVWEHHQPDEGFRRTIAGYPMTQVGRLNQTVFSMLTRARVGQVGNAFWGRFHDGPRTCLRCGGYESVGHLVGGCPWLLQRGYYTRRHNDVLRCVADKLEELAADSDLTFAREAPLTAPGARGPDGGQLRPDLTVVMGRGFDRKLFLLDVKVTHANVPNACQRVHDAYDSHVRAEAEFRGLHAHHPVALPLVFSGLGWAPPSETVESLQCLGMGVRQVIGLAKEAALVCARHFRSMVAATR